MRNTRAGGGRLAAAAALFMAATGCALPPDQAPDTDDAVSEEVRALKGAPVGPGVGGGGVIVLPPVGPTYAPPVSKPAHFAAGGRASDAATLTWYETGNPLNPETLIYRQQYDLDNNPVGAPRLVKTLAGLPQGPASFVDSAATSDDGTAPEADRKVCYYIQEKNGPCGPSLGGPTCVSSGWECVYTRATTPHKVGRVQLRIKVSSAATAAAPNAHVQVRLQSPFFQYASMPWPRGNNTWLDSTGADFTAGSDRTYDLKLKGISDLSDINQITIANPDDDWLCINEVELIVDNTTAFRKSWGADGVGCDDAWKSGTLDGTIAGVSFGELRRSPEWQSFNPPNLTPFIPEAHSFVGYRANELIAMLDANWGHELRNPDNGHGDGARLRSIPTTTTRVNVRRLRVRSHVVAEDWDGNGGVSADPEYDLVIHNDASCAPKTWCVAVEAVDGNSSSSGWWAAIPLIGAGIQIAINSSANGEIAQALQAMGGSSLDEPPAGTEYCFPSDTERSLFFSQGFSTGGFSLCGVGTGQRTGTFTGVRPGTLAGAAVAAKAQ
jgi:hypothetical protein